MRSVRLLATLTALVAVTLAPEAAARDRTVEAVDWQFLPSTVRITAGESVTWEFSAPGHTSTSLPNQAESWNSAAGGTNPAGTSFTHVFTRPGSYRYVCLPHESFMTGVVEVSAYDPPQSIAAMTTTARGRGVRVRFRLREPASVTYRVRGRTRRTVRRGRLGTGLHTLRVRRLRPGSYRGVLVATDASGDTSRKRAGFVVR